MKPTQFISPIRNKQKGFTLLEVLVTLVISALALLGIAALQAQALRMNKGGESRAQALSLATEIIERIEANNAGAMAENYKVLENSTYAKQAALGNTLACGAGCDPVTLANYDKAFWRNQIDSNSILPGGKGVITSTSTGAGVSKIVTYTVTVCWQERAEKYDVGTGTGVCGTDIKDRLPGLMSVTLNRTIYDRTASNGI
jgi:type IV pilus assembly protein PilV